MIKSKEDDIKEQMRAIIRRIGEAENKINWVRCPVCGEEWTKLMLCRVWIQNGEKKKPFDTHMCVSCGETPWKLEHIASMWPMSVGQEGIVFSKRLPKSGKDLSENLHEPHMWIIAAGLSASFNFEIYKRGNYIYIRGTGIPPEEPLWFDNSLAVWFWLRDRFEQGEPKELKNSGWK